MLLKLLERLSFSLRDCIINFLKLFFTAKIYQCFQPDGIPNGFFFGFMGKLGPHARLTFCIVLLFTTADNWETNIIMVPTQKLGPSPSVPMVVAHLGDRG